MRLFRSSFGTLSGCMVFHQALRPTAILASYQQYGKACARDWVSHLSSRLLTTQKQTVRPKEPNQDCERGLRTYTNYMQDDWKKWLPLVEFADNNNTSASSNQTPFYLNKGFHPRMDFSPDDTTYETVKKRVDSGRAQDIARAHGKIAR